MSVKMKPVSVIEMDLGLEPYGDAHRYFAERCMVRMNETYVPCKEGILSEVDYSNIDSECNIHYDELYAGYQYYGQRKDGSHKVNPDNYTKPGTGPYWDQLMLSAERKDLEQDMQDYIKKRGRK